MVELNPTSRELEILKTLWQLGTSSVREVHQAMCPDGELAFNTVQTLLRIMDDKGLVAHRRRGRAFIYEARHSRENETARILDQVFDGAMDQLVVSLLKSRRASSKQLRELEEIIASARREKRSTKKGR